MFSSNDSNFDVPSETSSSMITFCTPPQTPRKTRKMVVEVVIPIQKSAKRHSSSPVDEVADLATRRPGRIRISDPSPARSDSSISLGTHWHISPNKKRRRNRKGRDAAAEGEGEGGASAASQTTV
ncbi:hypothetical protein OPQ81_010491 [Rhizoctonia solani]|nr:hypothetical protein OPQ81_010491 [Rhizoctonia solani]